jgi:hypothetical protein
MGIKEIITSNEKKEKDLLKDEHTESLPSTSTSRLETLMANHQNSMSTDLEDYSTKNINLGESNGFIFLNEDDIKEKSYLESLDFDELENINSMTSENTVTEKLSQSDFEKKIKDILDCTNGITINLSNDGEIQQVTPKFEK